MFQPSEDIEQFNFENKRRIRRNDPTGATCSISEVRRDRQFPNTADAHALHAFVPASDDHALPKRNNFV